MEWWHLAEMRRNCSFPLYASGFCVRDAPRSRREEGRGREEAEEIRGTEGEETPGAGGGLSLPE